MEATIVMPADTPKLKIEATKEYGGKVVIYDRYKEDRAVIASQIMQESGATLVPPFDHRHLIAGQGTVTKELLEDLPKHGADKLDYLFVCVGGGGLISGAALAA